RVLTEAVDDFRERHAELVLVARGLDAVLDVRQFLAERPDAGQSARGAFHEGGEVGPEQIEAGIGKAAEIVRLERGARDDEGATEGAFLASLAITVVRPQFRPRRARV